MIIKPKPEALSIFKYRQILRHAATPLSPLSAGSVNEAPGVLTLPQGVIHLHRAFECLDVVTCDRVSFLLNWLG
jgi:hypothetical protein